MYNVCVLMSTYNGGKYLQEQIDSLIGQADVNLTVLVRDDGSSDSTTAILERYKQKGVLDWYPGENIGSARSFLDLVSRAPYCDYYALCDQDDYWFPEKLSVAISRLEQTDGSKSALYFCKTALADENLNAVEKKEKCDFVVLGMPEAFMFNYAKGCTMVFNRFLLDRIREYNPETIDMHDMWIYKVCLVTGSCIVGDETPHMLYRLHGDNVVGAANSFTRTWRTRFGFLKSKPHFRSKVAQEILRGYDRYLTAEEREQLQVLGNYRSSFRYWMKAVFSPSYSAPFLKYTVLFKLAVLFRVF